MSDARKRESDDDLPSVVRLPDGRLLWFNVEEGKPVVWNGSGWVFDPTVKVRDIDDAEGLTDDEIRALMGRGILPSR